MGSLRLLGPRGAPRPRWKIVSGETQQHFTLGIPSKLTVDAVIVGGHHDLLQDALINDKRFSWTINYRGHISWRGRGTLTHLEQGWDLTIDQPILKVSLRGHGLTKRKK